MKTRIVLLTLLGALTLTSPAAVAPQAVLPANTFLVASVPDMNAVRKVFKESPMSKMWNDKAMGDFADKFEDALDAKVLEPLLLFFDFDLEEYTSLPQGQITFALTRNPGEAIPGVAFLLDSGPKAKALAGKLANLREILIEEELLADRVQIGGVDFMRIQPPEEEVTFEGVYLGQSGSLLIATTELKLARQIVALHQKKAKKSLATHEGFAARHKAQLNDALAYGWVDFTSVLEIVEEQIEANADPEEPVDPLTPTPDKVITALGLKGLRSVTFSLQADAQGGMAELYFDVPKAGRRGLFAMMAPPAKDAGPPPFVTADTASFGRWRGDGAGLWKQFEDMLNEISPLAGGFLGMGEAAIRANQPEFRLKENLIETIGDDFIVIDSGFKKGGLEDLFTPTSLYLIKSKKPAVTLKSIQQIIAAVDEELEPEKRQVANSMIYSYFFEAGFNELGVHLSTAGEYLAICLDERALEKFLNGPKPGEKKLADLSGLKAAAEKVGGFNSGLFAYENQQPMARMMFSFLKENPEFLAEIIGQFGGGLDPEEEFPLNDFLDFKLLPDFKQVAKYFHFTVSGAETTPQGISFRMFAPNPPALKK